MLEGFRIAMIKSFKHKGLEKFFYTGSVVGIIPQHARKLRMILAILNTASTVSDMDTPGLRFHMLSGDRKGVYSVTVNGNWRITFAFENGDAYITNYEDYH